MEHGYVTMPPLPGIGFEGKSDLYRLMRELADRASATGALSRAPMHPGPKPWHAARASRLSVQSRHARASPNFGPTIGPTTASGKNPSMERSIEWMRSR